MSVDFAYFDNIEEYDDKIQTVISDEYITNTLADLDNKAKRFNENVSCLFNNIKNHKDSETLNDLLAESNENTSLWGLGSCLYLPLDLYAIGNAKKQVSDVVHAYIRNIKNIRTIKYSVLHKQFLYMIILDKRIESFVNAYNDYEECCGKLDVNYTDETTGLTALHLAIINDNLENVMFLVNNGANLKKQDKKYGFTALHFALLKYNYDIVKFILDASDDIILNIEDKKGVIPLAVYYKKIMSDTSPKSFKELESIFIEKGSKLDLLVDFIGEMNINDSRINLIYNYINNVNKKMKKELNDLVYEIIMEENDNDNTIENLEQELTRSWHQRDNLMKQNKLYEEQINGLIKKSKSHREKIDELNDMLSCYQDVVISYYQHMLESKKTINDLKSKLDDIQNDTEIIHNDDINTDTNTNSDTEASCITYPIDSQSLFYFDNKYNKQYSGDDIEQMNTLLDSHKIWKHKYGSFDEANNFQEINNAYDLDIELGLTNSSVPFYYNYTSKYCPNYDDTNDNNDS